MQAEALGFPTATAPATASATAAAAIAAATAELTPAAAALPAVGRVGSAVGSAVERAGLRLHPRVRDFSAFATKRYFSKPQRSLMTTITVSRDATAIARYHPLPLQIQPTPPHQFCDAKA